MSLAPIVLFVYNRPAHTLQTLEALMQNRLANESDLYIFADGNRENAGEEDMQKLQEVRKTIRSKQWCKNVHIIESDINKGLADSIIAGVTQIVNMFGKVIVLEDDIVTSPGFLEFMNTSLDIYEKEDKVMHISGYMYPITEKINQNFFLQIPLCWGWATWKRAWEHFDNNAFLHYKYFQNDWKRFNKMGGDFLESQLRRNLAGSLKSWFVLWHSSVLRLGGYSLFPMQSLVQNIGFDSSGVNNGSTTAYSHDNLANTIPVVNIPIEENLVALKAVKDFYNPELIYQDKHDSKTKKKSLRFLPFKNLFKKILKKIIDRVSPEFQSLKYEVRELKESRTHSYESNVTKGKNVFINARCRLVEVIIGNYTYVAENSIISNSIIGKFCSIGPNVTCGYGIHPINGISTAPMFYSTAKQNGITLSETDKIEERKTIYIGNDVFIGMNVTILDGVTIGDGAVIGAGAIVSKDIPAYAVAIGNPIQVIKYRFSPEQVAKLLKIKWWDFEEERLKDIEKHFFDVDSFISKYDNA